MLQKLNEISKGKNMMWNKVIAVMLVITLTFANFILLGVVAGKGAISYAADNLEAQDNSTQHANVKFDAYFVKDGAKSRTLMLEATETSKLYFALNVRNNGYLKNASIELNSSNYSIAAQLQASEIMEKIEGNKIILKQVNYGTEAIVDLPILLEINNEFKKDDVNKQSSLILRGIYVTKDGKEIEIEKEINIHLGWTGSTNAKLASDISKYIVNDEQKEIFLQEKIEISKVEKSLPIQKTILEVEVPKYNNILPEKVNVMANELGLTNGKQNEEIEFNNTNWKYDNQTGKVTIEVENKEFNGNIWSGLGKDEYAINYIFGEEAYNTKQEQNEVKINVLAKVYNYSGNEIKENSIKSEETKTLTEKVGNVVTGKVEVEQDISKGNMYANCNSNNREYETKYNVKEIVEIPYLGQVQNVNIQELPEQFLDENGNKNSTKIGGLNYTYYEKTLINADNFNKILGQDGYITIANNAGSEIGKIDANTKQEEGNYVFSYEEKQDSIILQTSTPIAEGNLIINHQKAIKADLPYTRNQIVAFKQLQSNVSIINNQEEVIVSNSNNLKETSTKVDMTINKQTITSENENVEIKLELNNTNEQSDLFVNPKFVIELPKNITTAKIEKAEVLFDNELKVKNYAVNTNENGNNQLEINLTGTQTKYNTVPNANGTTIVIQAKLGASQTGNGKAVLKLENPNTVQYSQDAITEVVLNSYIAEYLDITSYDEESVDSTEQLGNDNQTSSTDSTEQNQNEDKIENKVENSIKMEIHSNPEHSEIVLPVKPGSEFTYSIKLTKEFIESLQDDTASEVPELTYEETLELEKILIKIEELSKTENRTEEQEKELAKLLEEREAFLNERKEENSSEDNTQNTTNKTEWAQEDKERVEQINKRLEEIEKENTQVEELNKEYYQIMLKYADGDAKEYFELLLVETPTQEQINRIMELDSKVNQSETDKIFEKMSKEDSTRVIEIFEEKEKINNENEEVLKEQEDLNKELIEINKKYATGELKEYYELLLVENPTEEQTNRIKELEGKIQNGTINENIQGIKNIELKLNLSKYVTYQLFEISGATIDSKNVEYNKENNVVILKLDEFPSNVNDFMLHVNVIANDIEESFMNLESAVKLQYVYNNKKMEVEKTALMTIAKMQIDLIKTSEGIKEENSVGDEVKFKLQLKNVGKIDCNELKINFTLPKGLNFEKLYMGEKQEEITAIQYTEQGDIIIPINEIKAQDTIDLQILSTINNEYESKDLSVLAKVQYRENEEDKFEEKSAQWNIHVKDENTGSNDQNSDSENVEPNNQTKKYSISGFAWVDKNSDGTKSESEELLSGINVILVNVNTKQKVATLLTNQDGEYKFTNIEPGEYQVIFEYNKKDYNLTEYKKTQEEQINSNAIEVEDGTAITDVIKITNESIANINIGLVEIQKFDLKLEKRISKVTVQNAKETKTYNFNDSEIGKIEIDSKYVNGTIVLVEYVIKVINEGEVAGTVEKIVDYMPKDMIFSSDLNPSWIQDNSGNLYNTELSKVSIEPGETKQVSIVLRKNITEDNTGTTNNRAELVEVKNKYNLEDYDSETNNKVQEEDDISIANIIIGVKTGNIAIYVLITITSLMLLAVGIYLIKQKVFNVK